ncbi:hypothetical protein LPB90_18195 [Chryseobacterium sp. LC2016-29]|uniref:Ig-like domain-containing protein n=1 Tax=Chryseobacterium sp. LC2016-29 TaxID=2897331 RepID=UPI001E2AE560|nr:hypothetical protein [Chryseobacterium sp. LC2016-29]MCD0480373.1 hypothetical protein [Chryseobacterium sp. LC2016-29]
MKKYLLLLFTVLSLSIFGQYTMTADLITTPSGSNGIELKLDNINLDGMVQNCPSFGGYSGPVPGSQMGLMYEVYKNNVLFDKIWISSFGIFKVSDNNGWTLDKTVYDAYLNLYEYTENTTVGGTTWYPVFRDRIKTRSKYIYSNSEICNGNSYISDYKFVARYFIGTTQSDMFGLNWSWCQISQPGEKTITKPKIDINVTNENAVICKGQNITFQAGTVNGDQVAFYKDAAATIPYNATNQLILNTNTYNLGLNEFWVKVTNQGCTSIIKKVQFTVNEAPTDLVISGAQNSYCTGIPLIITPSANGSNITYQWSSTSNFANILDASFVDGQGRLNFIPTTTGNFTYYVRAKNTNGCSTDPKEVSFNVINGITNLQITNNGNAFCNTQPITFTAGANGATNYQWFKDNLGAVSLGSGNSVTLGTANWAYGSNTIYVRATNLACQTDLVPVTFTVNQVPTNIQVTGNVGNYCIGNPVLVTPSAVGGTGISYEWSLASNFATLLDANYVDGQGRLSYTPSVAGTFTYYVRAKSASGNCNSSVETVTFTVSNQVSNVNVTPTNPVVCFGSAVTFTASATNATSYKWTKDSQGVNVIGNASALTLSAGDYVLGANTIYLTVTNAGGCNVTPTPIAFTVNPSPSNLEITGAQSTYCTGNQILITPSATGTGLSFEWSSNSNFTNLLDASFVDAQGRLNFTAANTGSSTYYVRAFNGNCYSSTKTVTFTINTGVSNLQVSNNNGVFCKGDTVSFTVGATNATNYTWFKFNNATGVLQTGATYTPQAADYSLGVPTTIYVQASNGNGCSTALMPVTYTVNPSPENLQITGNANNYCVSNPILITPSATMQGSSANITYEWSLTSNFASILDANFVDTQGRLSYTPSSTGSLTYYVRAKSNNGCFSPSATVTFTVNSSIGILNITNQNAVVCNGQNVTFTAGATGASTYSWYQDAAGTISLGNNQNLTLQPTQYSLGVNKIYVQAKGAGGCNSAIIPVNFTVNQSPTNLVITGNAASYCIGSQIMVSPSAVGGGLTYEWASNINFTSLLGSSFVDANGNLNYVPTNTGTYTYYVRAFNGSCYSNVVTYTFNVVAGVGTLQVSNNNGSFCQGQTFNFTAGATGATTFNWYKFSNATGILSNGATYTPQSTDYTLDVQQTVYVQASNGSGCQTALMPVTFTVFTKPYDLQTSGNQNSYCLGTPVLIQPTASVGTGNISFEWSATSNFANLLGSTFVDASGNLSYTPSGSGTFTYYVRAKGSGGCYSDSKTVTFTVSNQVSNITVTPSNPVVCFGAAVSFSASATNATSYTWSTDSQGVNVIGNNSTLTLSSTQYTLGVNTIYLKVGNAGGCNGGSTPVSFTVNEAPTNLEVTGNANTYCTGSQVQISPSATGSNVVYEWSLNTNFTTLLDASYVNAQGILNFTPTTTGTYTYYVRAKNASGCATTPKTVTFVVNQGVGTLQVSNNNGSFCQGQTFGFTAGAVNATSYSWFKFSNGTGLLSTGSTFNPTASQYSLGVNTIYVQASSGNNCSTALLPVTFTVNAVPSNLETTGNTGTYCIGNAVMISPTATGGSSTTFEWSITSNFANLLGSSFVDAAGNLSYTPSSAGTFTYYVRAKGSGGCYSDTKTVTFTVSNQVSNITVTPSNPLVCLGSPVTFTASATNATTYKWTSDALGVNVIGNNSSITLQSTNYSLGLNKIYLTVGNAGGCNITPMPVSFTVNEAPSNLQITGQQSTYCSGNQILVTPTAVGTGLTFQWSASSNFATFLDASFVDAQGRLNYIPSSTGTFTYYVRATNGSGCYSNTETLTFTVNQGVNNLQVTNNGNSYCQGQTISMTAGAVNATNYYWYKFSNATGLLSTGATFNPTATQYSLGANTVYVQASSGNNCSTALLPVTFTVNAVPTNLETTGNNGNYCIGNPVLVTPSAVGSGLSFEWSATSNFANLLGSSFVDANGNLNYTPAGSGTFTYYVRAKGSGGCYSDTKTVTFTVSNQVSNVTVTPSSPTICFGTAVTFTAAANNATSYKWTKDVQGVNIIGTQSTLTLNASDYILGLNKVYLTVTNAGGCNATPMAVSFTVNEAPTNLEVTGNAGTYCTGGQVNISPSATGTGLSYEWATNSNFTNLLGAGMILPDGTLSFSPSTIGTVTYYVRAVNANGCATPPKTVTFNVNQGVGTLQVSNSNGVFCQGQPISFTAGAVNATSYSWFKFSNATGLMSTGATFSPTSAQYSLGSNTIYVQASSGNNCSTALLPVTFTVNAVPSNLETTGNAGTYCIGTPVLIQPSATGGANNIYEWSVTSNFVNLLGSSFVDANGNLSYTPSSAGTFTYYVRAKGLGGCYSDTKTLTFNVSNQVSNVTITPSNPSICFGSPVSFTASASNATSYTWSTDNQGANIIGNSASITLQSTSYVVGTNTIYLKVGNAGGCNVTPIPVSFTVNQTPTNLVVSGNAGNYCVGAPILITPSATGTGLIYEWSTSSLFTNILGTSFVDANGKLNFNASTIGSSTYYVRAKGQGGCVSGTETVTFVVNSNVGTLNITNQNAVICNGQNVSFTASASAANSYSWYQDAAGLVSIGNNQNITIVPADYALGSNTIYVQAKGAGGCNSAIVPVNFTVNTTPTNLVLTGNQSSYCSGSQILVTPSATGTGLTYQWSSTANFNTLLGTSFVDSDGRLNYVPSNTGTFTYYVRGTNGSGCYSNVETITFNVTQGVSNLQISNNNGSFCQGQTFSFTAGATGANTFNWYKFPNGTGLLFSGATFTPQATDYTIGANTIYVQAVAGNSSCSTAINPVNFTVNESPTAIAYTGETNYCLGQQVYIEPSALGTNLSYQWSTTANFAAGNILGSSFVDAQGNLSYTPTTTGTKIYYVRAFNGSCYSSGIPVTIVVNTQPTNLAVSKLTNIGQTTYCQNGSIEKYLATGVNISTYKWYTDVALTQEVLAAYVSGANNNTLNVDPSIWTVGTHNIYVVGENTNGCKTQAQSINFTIIAGVSTITPSINNFSMCQSETKVVNMDNPNNFTINWYTNSAGTVALSSTFISNNGNTLTLPAASFSTGQTTLYYKVQNAGGCMSTLMPVSFTVLTSPSNLTVTNNNASACLGQNIVFEASAQNATEFVWYKNYATGLVAEPQYLTGTNNYKLTIPSGNFTPGTYTYTVVAKNSTGCLTAPIDVTFTVQSVPGNSTLTGIVDYCKSETVHFELVNSSTVSFKWYNDVNGLNPVNASYLSNNGATVNIPASTFTTGSHTLYYYATNGNCNSITQSVTFTVKDTPSNLNTSGNNGTYCYGNLIDIVVGSQGGATNYEWFEDSAASLALNNIYITGANHERLQTSSYPVGVHTVYVRGVNANGCKSALLPISFTVNSAPVITTFATANATVQTGSPINFGVTGSGYTRWKLLFNGSQVAPAGGGWNNGTITNYLHSSSATLSNAGTYTLIISNGTCETQQNFTLYVIPQITITHDKLANIGVDAGVNKVILNQHDKIIFSSSIGTTPNYTEEWTYGDGFSNTTTSGEHVYNNPGEFTVKLKVVNTQNGDIFNVTYELPILVKPEDTVVPTDTLNPPDTNYTVYPNPYKEFLGLKFTGQVGDKFVLRIYDIRGISLFNTDWVADGVNWDKKWYSPLLNAPQGTYIVVVNNVTKGTKWSAKLLKQ